MSVNPMVAGVQQLFISDSVYDTTTISPPSGPPFEDPFDLSNVNEFQIDINGDIVLMKAITAVMDFNSLSNLSSSNISSQMTEKISNTIDIFILTVPILSLSILDTKSFPRKSIFVSERMLIFMDCKQTRNSGFYEKLKDPSTCDDLLRNGCQVRWYRGAIPMSKSTSLWTDEEMIALEKAFNAPFVTHPNEELSVVDCFDKYLIKCRTERRDGKRSYLDLFIPIVQSSGAGKSRLIKEMHRSKKYRVLYICCRDSNVVSYPKTSACYEWLISQVKIGADMVIICQKFIFCSLIAFKDTLDRFPDAEMVPMSDDANTNFYAVFDSKVLDADLTKLRDEAKSMFHELSEGVPVLFVLDEARSLFNLIDKETLTNAFVEIRRILYTNDFIVKSSKLVTIVIDTLSTVTNYAPPPTYQSSGRLLSRENYGTKLFQPFYAMTNYSVLSYPDFKAENVQKITSIQNDQGKEQLMALVNHKHRHLALMTIGRPLWAATFRAAAKMNDHDTFESLPNALNDNSNIKYGLSAVSDMAELKLACGAVEYVVGSCSSSERMFLTSVACMSVITGMHLSGTTPYAKKLMSSHAAWLHYISENSTWLQVGYLQEPALVEQSLLLQQSYMVSMLLDLKRACDERLVDAGTKGEWFCTILLVSARHSVLIYPPSEGLNRSFDNLAYKVNTNRLHAQVPISLIAPRVRLGHFLCMLGVPVKNWHNDRLGSLSVNCSHFIQLFSLPTENNIRTALVYGHGFMLPPGTRGADFAVPFVDDDGNIGMIFGNAKCYSDTASDESYDETVIQKLSPRYIWNKQKPKLSKIVRDKNISNDVYCPFLTAAVPYIGILVQFGDGDHASLIRDLVYVSDGSLRTCIVVPDNRALPCLKMYEQNEQTLSIKSIILDCVRNSQLLSTWKDKALPMTTFVSQAYEKMPSQFENVTVNSLQVDTRVLSE